MHLHIIASRISNALCKFRPLLTHLSLKNCREIIYSEVASSALYSSKLIYGQTQWTQDRFKAIMMCCNRAIFAKDFFKVNFGKILVDHPMEICAKAALKLIHKTICTKRQAKLFNQLKFNSKHRSCSKIGLKCNIRKEVNK